jgi:SAM-dependent methyltransferase
MDAQLYRDFARYEDNHWWCRGRRAVVREVLRTSLTPSASRRVLDVGCGTGGMLAMLQEFGEVEGLESSADAIARCQERFPSVRVRQGELPDGLAAGSDYDLICAFDVIEHIPDAVGALASMRAGLAPGGTLICTVPAYQFLWSEHDVLNHHQRRYTRALLQDQLIAAGLQPTFSSYFNTALFSPIAAVRLAQRVLRGTPNGSGAPHSDFSVPPAPVNRLLEAIFSAERFLVPRLPLPFGVSLISVAH